MVEFKMKRQIKIILFIILCTSILGAYTYTNSQKKLTKEAIAEKVEGGEVVNQDDVVYFAINGYKFEVATKYMQKIGRSKESKEIVTAQMWALLPDFEAYDKNKNHNEFYEERGHGKRVNIYVYSGGTLSPLKKLKKEGLYNDFLDKKFSIVSESHDLEKYPEHSFKKDWDLYIWRDKKNIPRVVFNCVKNVPSPGCKMVWNSKNNAKLYHSVSYSMKYLSHWKQIKEKTELLIKNQL